MSRLSACCRRSCAASRCRAARDMPPRRHAQQQRSPRTDLVIAAPPRICISTRTMRTRIARARDRMRSPVRPILYIRASRRVSVANASTQSALSTSASACFTRSGSIGIARSRAPVKPVHRVGDRRRHRRDADLAGARRLPDRALHDPDLDLRDLVHARHRVVVKIRLLHDAVPDRDVLAQPRRHAPDDAGFELLAQVARLYRRARDRPPPRPCAP